MILGCFLDGISMVVLTMAVLLPMVQQAGFDLIWFGIFIVIVVEMAQITPPVGFNLFVLQGMTKKQIPWIARVTLPLFMLMVVARGAALLLPRHRHLAPGADVAPRPAAQAAFLTVVNPPRPCRGRVEVSPCGGDHEKGPRSRRWFARCGAGCGVRGRAGQSRGRHEARAAQRAAEPRALAQARPAQRAGREGLARARGSRGGEGPHPARQGRRRCTTSRSPSATPPKSSCARPARSIAIPSSWERAAWATSRACILGSTAYKVIQLAQLPVTLVK